MLLNFLVLTECWALLIPITCYLINRQQPVYLKPIVTYIFLAFPLTLFAGLIHVFLGDRYEGIEPWLSNNNHIYNLLSIIRLICFTVFFNWLKQPFATAIKRWLPVITVMLIAINFGLGFEQFFLAQTISSRLFAIESGVLLFFCLLYFLYRLQEEKADSRGPDFWIVIGLSIYVVTNFPFFLTYAYLSDLVKEKWWHVHNVIYLVFCIFIAKAFATQKHDT